LKVGQASGPVLHVCAFVTLSSVIHKTSDINKLDANLN
jgi:hypothetical protein